MLFIAGVLLVSAGRLDLAPIWEYLGLFLASGVVGSFLVDPGLIRERWRPGGKSLPPAMFLLVLLPLAHWSLAGMDVGRYHWSDTVPPALQVASMAGVGLCLAVLTWAVHVNPFFSSVIRIQTERGHKVVRHGPYRFVRHPGYAVALLLILLSGLALGSWLAAAFGLAFSPLLFVRIVREDRTLLRELPGYDRYAQEVRFRIVPGVW